MNLGKCWHNGEVVNKIFLSNGNTEQSSLTMYDKEIDRRQEPVGKHFHALVWRLLADCRTWVQSRQQAALDPRESTQSHLVPRISEAPKQKQKETRQGLPTHPSCDFSDDLNARWRSHCLSVFRHTNYKRVGTVKECASLIHPRDEAARPGWTGV